jgi:hypothetical protein
MGKNKDEIILCYKKIFSTVSLDLTDAHYRFIVTDVGAYGKHSDGGKFNNSNLGKSLKNYKLQIPPGKQIPGSGENLPYVITNVSFKVTFSQNFEKVTISFVMSVRLSVRMELDSH